MIALPEDKRKAIVTEFGDHGQRWVDEYPHLISTCAKRWKLTLLGIASAGLPINVIHYAKTDLGQSVVLKVGVPHPEQKTELIALRHYAGRHAVRVIDWDGESGAVLMERISPGTQLRRYEDLSMRSKIKIKLISELPIPLKFTDGLPTIAEWLNHAFHKFRESNRPSEEFLSFIVAAETAFAKIKTRYPEAYLLHGDLHHENILRDHKLGWVAIDPKGVVGPKIMECGRFLQNFIEDEVPGAQTLSDAMDEQIVSVLEQRYAVFNEVTGFEIKDLATVTFIDQVLSSCWSINLGQSVDYRKIRIIKNLLTNI
jgi:streptomycin 6-kinase